MKGDKWVNGEINNDAVPGSILRSLKMKTELANPARDSVYRLLSNEYFKSYKYFATTYYYKKGRGTDQPTDPDEDPTVKDYLSLEGIHNMIHNGIGGFSNDTDPVEGHMTEVPWAAFEPLFWIHHW